MERLMTSTLFVSKAVPSRKTWRGLWCPANLIAQRFWAPEGGYIPNPYGRDLGLGYRVRTPSSQEGDRGVETIYVMNIEEKKADFMRRFKASRERKAEYIAQMEKRMRDDYRRRTGKEAESFCVL